MTDPDGLEGAGSGAAASLGAVSWQWARSSEGSTWTSVDVYADGDSYTPTEDDEGMWLKVTAAYTDGHGQGKSAEAITAATVGAREASPELTVTELVTGLTHPWDIAFTPDGTMLFTERDDGLRVRLTDGTVRQVTADFSDLNFGGNAGLLALVLDPDFRVQPAVLHLPAPHRSRNAADRPGPLTQITLRPLESPIHWWEAFP